MKAEQIPIFSHNDMFFMHISVNPAEILKISRLEEFLCCNLLLAACLYTNMPFEESTRPFVEPVDYDDGEEEDDKFEQGHEGEHEETEEDGDVFANGKPSKEGDGHGTGWAF
jgi:hypothetical protein